MGIDIGEYKDFERKELTSHDIKRLRQALESYFVNSPPPLRNLLAVKMIKWMKEVGIDEKDIRKIFEGFVDKIPDKIEVEHEKESIYSLMAQINRRKGVSDPEGKALNDILMIEEIIGRALPLPEPVISLLDFEKQYYAVADPKRCILMRARRTQYGLQWKEIVLEACPIKVIMYRNPAGGIPKFEIEFISSKGKFKLGPAYLKDILSALEEYGLVKHRRLLQDVFSAVISKMPAEIREEIDKPGIYLVNGEIKLLHHEICEWDGIQLEPYLKDAKNLVKDLIENWYPKAEFVTVLKWGVLAPFGFVIKQKGNFLPWLYIFGPSKTGKTTMGRIILRMWNLGIKYEKGGSAIDTVARLGNVLESGTFPILINEPRGAFEKESVVEMMKSAIEGTVARAKFERGVYREIPALATLMFTSNYYIPQDDALLRRFVVVELSYKHRIKPEKESEFRKLIEPQFPILRALGKAIFNYVKEHPDVLDFDRWEEASINILEKIFEGVVDPEVWELEAKVEAFEGVEEALIESIRCFLIDEINRRVKDTYLGLEGRLEKALEENLVPYLSKIKENEIVITTQILKEMERQGIKLGSLKQLAELLGWEYKKVKKLNKWVVVVDKEKFLEFLVMKNEEESGNMG